VLIARAELAGCSPCDVRIAGGRIAEIGADLARRPGEPVLDARGGALLPGLHDHHLHLFALAAALRSVPCGRPHVRDAADLARALRSAARTAAPGAWLRGVDYHEAAAGPLDRHALDRCVPDRPVRVQHQSGDLWILNTLACRAALLEQATHAGVERDAAGRPTGRVFRADAWLRARLPASEAPSLAEVGRLLARCGVTGLTDATPANGADELGRFAAAIASGALPQRLVVMGRADLPEPAREDPRIARGALKLRLAESELPRFEALVAEIERAHADARCVALHAVTRAELVFATAAFAAAGVRPGDRIEHAAVAAPENATALATLGLTVVMQPGLVATRGDRYRRDVAPGDAPYLYACRSLLAAGVALGGSTDAPFGDPDPWSAMRAAVDRRAPDGTPLGAGEALTPEQALALFTGAAAGGPPRRVEPGVPADLCLLGCPWSAARRQLERSQVVATWCDGRLAWSAADAAEASSDSSQRAITSHAC
jgi:predicted amidohydrolase YtcJ